MAILPINRNMLILVSIFTELRWISCKKDIKIIVALCACTLIIVKMIINSILSLAFLWTWRHLHFRLRELQQLRRKISSEAIQSVGQLIKNMEGMPERKRIFGIVKGLLRLRVKLRGEKSIYSLIDLNEIKQGRLSEHLMRKSWEELADKAYWKKPHNTAHLEFDIQDMANKQLKIAVKGCKENSLSGALNELYKDRNLAKEPSNLVGRALVRIFNMFVNRAPLSYLLNSTRMGEELTLYGVQDGQYSLVMGEFERIGNQLLCKDPQYVTKQRSYVEVKIRKHQKRLMLITFLLASLLLITGIKFVRKLYAYFRQWRLRRSASDDDEPVRSEDQGDNCNCIVCYENVRNIIFKPCLHYAVCKSCFKLLHRSSCPYCKEHIEDTIEVVKRK